MSERAGSSLENGPLVHRETRPRNEFDLIVRENGCALRHERGNDRFALPFTRKSRIGSAQRY